MVTKEQAKEKIAKLVEKFQKNLAYYKSKEYNEAQARKDFIDPFFEALGWDVRSEKDVPPQDREVLVETGEARRRPDYTFRISRKTKFFVEAKPPRVPLDHKEHILQAKSYAWSKEGKRKNEAYFVVLTDFEDTYLFDATLKPNPRDPTQGRIWSLSCGQYLDRFEDLWKLSRDAAEAGELDALLLKDPKSRRQRKPVDEAFLEELQGWREALAKDLYKQAPARPELRDVRLLNEVVQRILDRLVFVRIAEDRGVLDRGKLQRVADIYRSSGKPISGLLNILFKEVNEKLNGEIFKPGHAVEQYEFDSGLLQRIIEGLYSEESSYRFDAIPVELLGTIYERYLGTTIHLTEKRVKVEEKPEVRKAGGVFYTPEYIVDYIVENTVGKLIEGKSPEEVAKLKILDPACGSGSFLLGAYRKLIDYHIRRYQKNPQEAGGRLIPGTDGEEPCLTLEEKCRILKNNIYGVDIDQQAVEITMMSLYIKALEGERVPPGGREVLPRLAENVRCGNSLIGFDVRDVLGRELTAEEARRVNAFDWKVGFPEVLGQGGFDAVIGNPPYGAEFSAEDLRYIREKFKGGTHTYDSYELFLLKSATLLKKNGRLSMIIPASWLTGDKYEDSRKQLVTSLSPEAALALPFDVFEDAYIDTAIIVLSSATVADCLIHVFPKKERLQKIPIELGTPVPIENIRNDSHSRLSIAFSSAGEQILRKFSSTGLTFGDWFDTSRGVQPYSRQKHSEEQIKRRFLHAPSKKTKEHLPELQGNELSRYFIEPKRVSYLRYCNEIASIRPIRMFQGERIVLRRLLTRKFRLQASFASETWLTTDNVLNMVPKTQDASVKFALGILNSKIVSWIYVNTSMVAQKDDFPQVHISALAALPLPKHDKKAHDDLVRLVDRMLELHKQRAPLPESAERERVTREIEATDRRIDEIVYGLYGITDEERRIIEGVK